MDKEKINARTPKTTFEQPKTHERDYREYNREVSELIVDVIKGNLNQEKASKIYRIINEKYKDKIFEEDKFSTKSFFKYLKYLIQKEGFLGLKVAIHEWGHARKAKKLGYDVKFSCFYTRTDDPKKLSLWGQVTIPTSKLKINDLEAIASNGRIVFSVDDKNLINYIMEGEDLRWT